MDKHIIYIGINGIYCEHCITTITRTLMKLEGVTDVVIKNNVAEVTGNPVPDPETLIRTICEIGYETDASHISERKWDVSPHIKLSDFVMILSIIILIAYSCRRFLGFNIFTLIPTIDSNITYGMLIVTGLLTSLHCVCMCGALNLSASTESNTIHSYARPVLYNIGRVISYTITGGIVGLIGSVISINTIISGIIVTGAAVIMLLLSLRMLGLVDYHLPHILKTRKLLRIPRISGRKSAFIIGIFNGLMPCGPLQAMQLYALSTGSPILGALSMFLFAIGTVPLMFVFGMISNILKGKTREWIYKTTATLLLVLSVVMANRGLSIIGIHSTQPTDTLSGNDTYDEFISSTIENGIQKVSFHLSYSEYADIVVQKDIPVKMNIIVDEGYLTGCNNEVISRDFDFDVPLSVGSNTINFTPDKIGDYTYTCWMNMIENKIKVIDDKNYFEQ